MTVLALPRGLSPLVGWCVACRAAGDLTPAVDAGLQVCGPHLRLLPRRPSGAGQLQLQVDAPVVPMLLRAGYATGERQWCADCVAAGRAQPRLGLAERTAGDPTALCMTCWRSRTDRALRGGRRGLSPEHAGWVADLQVRLACEACGRSDGAGDCWLCGDQVMFLAAARAVHEVDQAQAARDGGRVDELRTEHEEQLELVRLAGKRLNDVRVWQARVARVSEAMPQLVKTGSHGQMKVKRGAAGWARAWWLLADFLARDAADRGRRGVRPRGRPAEYPRVVAVMAIDANYRTGAKSMAGLDPTALFAGVSRRTVTAGWARTVQVQSTTQVEAGRGCTFEERTETGRRRQRAVYDFVKLHRSRFDPAPFLGEAAAVIAGLLQRAADLVDEHQELLEEAHRAADAAEARLLDAQAVLAEHTAEDLQLQAAVSDVWADEARQALSAAATARARATRALAPPVDRAAVVAAQRARQAVHDDALTIAQTAAEQAIRIENFCYHPRRGTGKKSSSGSYWGLQFSAKSSPLAAMQRPHGRGEDHRGGAPRPSPTKGVARGTGSPRPRTVYRVHQNSPGQPRRSGPPAWAKELAVALAERWDFLQRYLDDASGGNARAAGRARGLRLCQIAATLASRLGPQWRQHAADVVRLVERHAGIFSVIAPGDAHSPLAYLARMLDKALSNPDAVVPWPSPVRDRVSAATAATTHATTLVGAAVLRTAFDDRDTAAAADRAGPQRGLAAARAAAAAAVGRELPRPIPPGGPADAARMAAARAEIAQRAAGNDWPVEARPGAGLPDDWRRATHANEVPLASEPTPSSRPPLPSASAGACRSVAR